MKVINDDDDDFDDHDERKNSEKSREVEKDGDPRSLRSALQQEFFAARGRRQVESRQRPGRQPRSRARRVAVEPRVRTSSIQSSKSTPSPAPEVSVLYS